MTDTVLQLANVNKYFGGSKAPMLHAVRDVSLDIKSGEIIALLGSSGCGKTTTLRMIAGFEQVSSGRIDLGGRAIHDQPPGKRGVAMAFEGYSLYPPLTVRENIGFALKSSRLVKSQQQQQIDDIAHLLEIQAIMGRYPSSISAGQQQRVSLGRALIRRAAVTLLDEPMGQLEPQLRAVLRGRLKKYLREHGMTTVLVTHDQTEANALADRIAVMEGGVIHQFASPAELKHRPATRFVAGFIGEPPMTLFNAEFAPTHSAPGQFAASQGQTGRAGGNGCDIILTDSEKKIRFAATGLSDAVTQRLLALGTATIGIRPHDVRLSQVPGPGPGSEQGENSAAEFPLTAAITANQWLGDQTHLALSLDGLPLVAVVHRPFHQAVGARISLSLAADKLHIFDLATERAVLHHGVWVS
ncbi:MAG: ABC transporter ATP-binding protein [Candidatus Symbiobacter sp.]|nr:ABC transporter ATP-binding protein [Candidatus Symbiobacter sp.]